MSLHPETGTAQLETPIVVPSVTKVAIAVVESAGHFLVGTRSDTAVLPGMSEFPGGKCESDETPRSCAVRECREETGLIIIPREHLTTITHDYDHGTVELHFWRCHLSPDVPDLAEPQSPFQWVAKDTLGSLEFPEANSTVLKMLTTADSLPPMRNEQQANPE